MTNTINKVIQNGTEYLVGGVTSVNGQQGAVTVEPGITKIFELASTSDLTTAQQAYDWYANGGNPIIKYGNSYLILASVYSSYAMFARVTQNTTALSIFVETIRFGLSSGSVTEISDTTSNIRALSTPPTSGTSDFVVTLVI